jgi:hypothetical protein
VAENLNSNPSDWVVGESDPSDFTADAVAEALKDASDEEKQRVAEAEGDDGRKGVLSATEEADDSDESKSDSEDKEDDGVVDYSKLDPSDENYTPYQDPAVGSSVLADVIVNELAGGDGKSPTLDACREAYKDAQKS